MKAVLILLCLVLIGCSQAPVMRGPASIEPDVQYGTVDIKKSQIKIFPGHKGFFYLELKDAAGKLVDCDPDELSLRKSSGTKVSYELERSARGKFYVIPKDDKLPEQPLKVYVRGVAIEKEVRLVYKKADRNKSWLKAVRSERNGIKLRLYLGDAQGKPVEIPSSPEIILDGQAQIDNVERVAAGTWEFEVIYPNYNQVIYISVRAHGTYLADLFRVQHIEK